MSIIIQFNSSAFSQSTSVPSTNQCYSKRNAKLEMVPGIEHSDVPGMTDDENSIDIASSSIFSTTLKEVKFSSNNFGSCFGLPYQDHNYGAPPPPTPPITSPCPSPSPSAPILDEDTTLSVISNSTNEDVQEESITRCICGFEHDDEYMICCDNCLVWQHVDCMGLDRNNIPDTYLCDKCEPRKLDRHKAKLLQSRKKSSLTAKLPNSISVKPEPNFNNKIFGKDKKKCLAQTSEDSTHAHKTEFREGNAVPIIQKFYYSSDSDEEINKNSERRPKTRSKRRKKEEEKSSEISDSTVKKKPKKHGKERMEAKRSKLRRGKNKESTSTADEEAQDAWEYSLEWCEKNFEDAINNQYTPEIQHFSRTLSVQGFEKKYLEQMRTKQCHAYDDGKRKQLVCLRDLPRNSPLIEYKGKFLLASQFLDLHPLYTRRLYPYVLFYMLDQKEICVDASLLGNDARFVRRSCKPNAEIRHMVYNGKLHLYLVSTRVIFREDEVTIPLIIHPNDNLKEFECACGTDECLVKPKKKNGTIEVCQEKRRRTRRSTATADEDSNHSIDIRITRNQAKASNALNEKPKLTAVKNEPIEPQALSTEAVTTLIKEEPEIKHASDNETDETTTVEKRKLTREERKLDAILRAFRQMEQAEKRKQLALEKQKSNLPKLEVCDEKPEEIKKEEKPNEVSEIVCKEEEKIAPLTPKSKKGKRRRGSGTPSRRRTRTNSGGSDLLSLDEASPIKATQSPESNSISCNENITQLACSSPTTTSTLNILSPNSSAAPPSPHILKTKRALMNEWLQEKSEAAINTTPSPLPVHTEMNCNIPTHYVRCTKDTPHSSGISAAHLRRSNSVTHLKPASGQGSAKKRWLRQAMYDCHGCEIQVKFESCIMESTSNLDNDYLSPNSHCDVDSLNGVAEDVLTPLKKRRLMRESIESLPSPQSPSTATSIDDTDTTTVSNSLISDNSTEHGIDVETDICSVGKDPPSPTVCLKSSRLNAGNIKFSNCQERNTTDENSKLCNETSLASISSVELISGENGLFATIEPSLNTSETSLSDKNNEGIEEPSKQCESNLNTKADSPSLETCTSVKSPHITESLEQETSSITKISAHSVNSENQSSLEVVETKKSDKEIIAQEQSQNVSAAISSVSFVNNITDNKISIPSYAYPSGENSVTPVVTKHSLTKELTNDKESSSEFSNLPVQNCKDIFPSKNVINLEKSLSLDDCEKLKSSETFFLANNQNGESTNSTSETPFNQTLYSSLSSCNNVDSSNCSDSVQVKNTEIVIKVDKPVDAIKVENEKPKKEVYNFEEVAAKENSQTRCISNNDSSPDKKEGVSTTKKRKVSLSEYRMRMKENSGKVRANAETSSKAAASTGICAITLPDTLPEQVTLAPLPLFDKEKTRLSTSKQDLPQTKMKRKDILKKEEGQEASEHRENLNERLKREFGFDVLEGDTTASILKSKISGVSTSESLEMSLNTRSSPPPPPPPPPRPRHIRHSMQASVNSNVPPSRFGFSAPFPRSQFMVTQVPGAPYLQTQPPILPHVHQLNNNARCGLQPPLLPSAHPFSSSMSGTLSRPPPSHDYTPVNAQRFAAMVQQPPPPPHKSYLSVYPSVLYK